MTRNNARRWWPDGVLTLLVTGVLIAWTAPGAWAAGINLSWDDCGSGGVSNKTFACDTNDGYRDLYVSVDPPPGITLTNGHNHLIDVQSQSSPLPAWWEFKNAGSCRQTSLIGSADFSTGSSGGAGCADPWQGQGAASVAAYNTNFNGIPCRVRMVGTVSVPEELAGPMEPGTEYYSAKFRVNSAKTVGADACGDCPEQVCLVLTLLRIAQPPGTPGGDVEVGAPLVSNYVTWQGGPSWCPPGSHGWDSCQETPTIPRTWGLIKGLYR